MSHTPTMEERLAFIKVDLARYQKRLEDKTRQYDHLKNAHLAVLDHNQRLRALNAAAPNMLTDLKSVRTFLLTLYDEGNAEAGSYAAALETTINEAEGRPA